MIISASRRTDIPAFYSEWFMNRIREGYCQVPNSYNTKLVSQVSLDPADVEAIIFWSKNPAPLIPYLDELDERGFNYYFQYTLNNYPRAIEQNVQPIGRRFETLQELSNIVGSLRVIWRYDPIIISNITDYHFHEEVFSQISEELRGFTRRVMVSIIDFYKKTERRLLALEKEVGFRFERNPQNSSQMKNLLKTFHTISKDNDMEIFTCAEETDFSSIGIQSGKCIDDELVKLIQPLYLKYKKDPTQRTSCLCTISKDIGINNTCIHGCQYCYSTSSLEVAYQRYDTHNSHLPAIWGSTGAISKEIQDDPQPRLL